MHGDRDGFGGSARGRDFRPAKASFSKGHEADFPHHGFTREGKRAHINCLTADFPFIGCDVRIQNFWVCKPNKSTKRPWDPDHRQRWLMTRPQNSANCHVARSFRSERAPIVKDVSICTIHGLFVVKRRRRHAARTKKTPSLIPYFGPLCPMHRWLPNLTTTVSPT